MNKVPSLRFKEFSGEWEEKKLKNIVEVNPKTEELPDEFIYIDLESVENGILKEKKIIQKENAPSRAKRNVKLNDILYQTVRPYQQNNLFFNFDDKFEYIASTGYAQLRSIKNNSKYIYHMLHTKKFLDKVLERCTGTSYPAINSNDLSEINIFYTPFLEEQEKIGNFLSSVDKKISIVEEKLNLFNQYKKGIMQKIFNQELRFKDENGNNYPKWEERKLGEISSFTNGKGHEQFIEKHGKYIIVNSKFISSNGLIKKYTSSLIVPLYVNDILMVMSDVPNGKAIGKCFLVNEENKYSLNQRICALRTNESPKYLYYFLNRNSYFLKFDDGISQTNLKKDEVLNCPIFLPCLEEQKKIADFLSAIDDKIENISGNLESLKLFKKSMLQKMFV